MNSIVERLRGFKSAAAQVWAHEAADLIQQQAARIAELETERDAERDNCVAIITTYQEELATANQRIKELEAANLKLIRGDFNQMCSYCGLESPGNGDSWGEMMAHIHCCDKHPLKKANDKLAALHKKIEDAPVVAWKTINGKVFDNGFVRDTDIPLISKEDLQG